MSSGAGIEIGADRREDVRLAGCGAVAAVVVDGHGQPIEELEGARLVNVSAGGAALVAEAPVSVGAEVVVTVGSVGASPRDEGVHLRALACSSYRGDRYKTRCALAGGAMPAELMYGW